MPSFQNFKYFALYNPSNLLSTISSNKCRTSAALRNLHALKFCPNTKPKLWNKQPIKYCSKCSKCPPCPSKKKSLIACYEEVNCVQPSICQMLIDVRTPEECCCLGTITNSINIPVEDIHVTFSLPPQLFLKTVGVTKPEMDAELIFYSNKGVRSKKAMLATLNLAYLGARNYKGGFREWKRIRDELAMEKYLEECKCNREKEKKKWE